MKNRLIAAIAAASLISFAPAAFALPPQGGPGGPFKHPMGIGPAMMQPMRHNYYYHHDRDSSDGWKSAAIGAGIGLLMSAIANSSSASGNSAMVSQAQNALQNEADNQQQNIAQLISRQGVKGAMQTLTNYWQNAGETAAYTPGNPISMLQVSGFSQQPNVSIQYTVNQATSSVTVTVANPGMSQSAQSTGTYTLPAGYNPFTTGWNQPAF